MRVKDKHILITAGPTREAIDPVRYISNRSSGKMAYAIANACANAGAKVTVISGPTCLNLPASITRIDVTTALQMHEAALTTHCDIFIAAAAVSDYRVENASPQKIKKNHDSLTLHLVKNPDILTDVSKQCDRPFCVGFAAETEQLKSYALKKLKQKKLDLLVANLVADDKVFEKDDSTAVVFSTDGQQFQLPTMHKEALADKLVTLIEQFYQP